MERNRDRNRRRPYNRVNSKQRKDNRDKEENKDTEEFEIIDTRHYYFKGLANEVKYLGGSNLGKYIKTLKKGNVLECQLFYKGILLSSWSEVNGKHIGKEVTYERGIVSSVIDNDKSFKNTQRYIENQKQGPALTIYDETTEKMIYRGDFNSNYERHGKGTEYYPKTGNVKLVGMWESDKLRQVVKEFEDDEMIEYADGHDNLDVSRRIPLYIGGYTYDEENDEYVRHGSGCILDRYGKAIHEGVWVNGEEKSGTDLYDGWYEDGAEAQFIQNVQEEDDENDTTSVHSEIDRSSTQLEIRSKEDIRGVNFHIRELIVYPSFNGYVLKLFNLKSLKTIEIGDSCLQNVSSFSLSNLPGLVSVKIGKNCSEKNCSVKNVKMMKNKLKLSTNKSFSIQNCRHLKLIDVGEGSFIDFGRFEITNCQKLDALSIGSEKDSWNFFAASFIIQSRKERGGMRDL